MTILATEVSVASLHYPGHCLGSRMIIWVSILKDVRELFLFFPVLGSGHSLNPILSTIVHVPRIGRHTSVEPVEDVHSTLILV